MKVIPWRFAGRTCVERSSSFSWGFTACTQDYTLYYYCVACYLYRALVPSARTFCLIDNFPPLSSVCLKRVCALQRSTPLLLVMFTCGYWETSRTAIVPGSFASETTGRCGPPVYANSIHAMLAWFENVLRPIRALCALTTTPFLSPGNRFSGMMRP